MSKFLNYEFGIRDKSSLNHWKKIDISNENYRIVNPTVICLGGNQTYTAKEANGFCKRVEKLLSKGDYQNEVNICGISYGVQEGEKDDKDNYKYSASLNKEERSEIVNKLLMPLCIDDFGQKLDIEKCCQNLSLITFCSWCHGAHEVFNLLLDFNSKLLAHGFTADDTDKILGSVWQITYAPFMGQQAFLSPSISFYSENDPKMFSECEYLSDLNKNNNKILVIHDEAHKFAGLDRKFVFFETLNIKIPLQQGEYHDIDSHSLDIIGKTEDYTTMGNMLSCCLCYSVKNAMLNVESNCYQKKSDFEKFGKELQGICENKSEEIETE